MYGVPADLNLDFLRGAELIQVCLGQHQAQLHFYPTGTITIEGGWELNDATGNRIDGKCDDPDRPPYQLHRLLGYRVIETAVFAPRSISLSFEKGLVLRVFDDSTEYESISIEPCGVFI